MSGNSCYHSVQNLLSSSLLSKNLKIKKNKIIILPIVLYGCETWSLTLREEHWLRVFENRVLRRIFGPKRNEATGEWRKLHNKELNDLYSSLNIIQVIKSRRMRREGHLAHMGKGEVYTGFRRRNIRDRNHLEDHGIDGRIILRWILRKWDWGAWTGLIWLRLGTGTCKCGNAPSGSIKCKEFLDYLKLVSFSRTLLHAVIK